VASKESIVHRREVVVSQIRLNRQILKPDKGKDYASVVFIGDTHHGSPQFDKDRFLRMLDFCKKNNRYVFLMGDLIELATRDSVGAGVYEQEFIGQKQFEEMLDWLKPLADKNLIIGFLAGNHERRAYKSVGFDISRLMARELGVRYLGDACWNTFRVGKQTYSIYSLHGRSGARFDGTALLAVERISSSFFGDMVVMAHMHKCVSTTVLMQRVYRGRVREHKKHLLITGSYLTYDGSYGQTYGLPMSKLGSPKVKFFASRHDIHTSW